MWLLKYLSIYRYGHSCLMMELAGTEGVLVSGGALTGKSVQFFDLESKRCVINSLFIPNLI